MEGLFTSGSIRHTEPQFLPTGVHKSHPVFFPLQQHSITQHSITQHSITLHPLSDGFSFMG